MLISVLITFLVVILVLYLINLLPLDGRAKQIARVVVIILGVISLLKYSCFLKPLRTAAAKNPGENRGFFVAELKLL